MAAEPKKFEIGIAYAEFVTARLLVSLPPPPMEATVANSRPVVMSKASFNEESSSVTIGLSVKINLSGDDGPITFIEAITQSVFFIQGAEQFKEDDGVQLPDEIVATLLSAAYATTRGVIIGRGAGMIADSFILPLITPQDLLNSLQIEDSGHNGE